MLSQKSHWICLLSILASIDVVLSILLLSRPGENPCNELFTNEVETLSDNYAHMCASDLRNTLLRLGVWKDICGKQQLGAFVSANPCGVCLSTQMDLIEDFLEHYSGDFVIIIPDGMERKIKSSFVSPQDVTLVSYNPTNLLLDNILDSFEGMIYYSMVNGHIDDVFISYKSASARSTKYFLSKFQ